MITIYTLLHVCFISHRPTMFDKQRLLLYFYLQSVLYLNWNFFVFTCVFDNQIFVLQDQHMELYSCFLAQLWYVLPVYLQALSISNSFEYLKHILFLTCLRRQLNKSLFNNSVNSNLTSRLRWFALTINVNQIYVCDVS